MKILLFIISLFFSKSEIHCPSIFSNLFWHLVWQYWCQTVPVSLLSLDKINVELGNMLAWKLLKNKKINLSAGEDTSWPPHLCSIDKIDTALPSPAKKKIAKHIHGLSRQMKYPSCMNWHFTSNPTFIHDVLLTSEGWILIVKQIFYLLSYFKGLLVFFLSKIYTSNCGMHLLADLGT